MAVIVVRSANAQNINYSLAEISASVSSLNTSVNNKLPLNLSISQKTGNYTIGSGDSGKIIEMGAVGGTQNNVTIPSDGTNGYTFPIGSQITILQTTVNQTTIIASGVTINATPGLKLRTQWSSATLIKRAANVWIAIGDLVA